jgi:hypothetical protein
MLLMLIDTRDEPPAGDPRQEPWFITALRWALPWPALVLWLYIASELLDGWAGVIALWGAIIVGTWRLLRAIPEVGGMRDYHQ